MSDLGYDRCRTELVAETDRFADALRDTDPGTPVPTCPCWTLADLAAHVGRTQRQARETVARRAGTRIPDDHVPDREPPADAGELDDWLRTGARRLAAAVERIGPHTPVWTWADPREAGFWARRALHDALVHRADAALAAGQLFTADPEVAADAVSEWLDLLCAEEATPFGPGPARLAGGGERIRLEAIDEGLGADGRWLVTRDPRGARWAHHPDTPTESAATGKAVDLMLVVTRRARPGDRDIELTGDPAVLDGLLEHSCIG